MPCTRSRTARGRLCCPSPSPVFLAEGIGSGEPFECSIEKWGSEFREKCCRFEWQEADNTAVFQKPVYFCLKIQFCIRCHCCELPVRGVRLQTWPARTGLAGSETPGQPGHCWVGSTLLHAAVSLRSLLQGRVGRSRSAPSLMPGVQASVLFLGSLFSVFFFFFFFLFFCPPNSWFGQEGRVQWVPGVLRCRGHNAWAPSTRKSRLPSLPRTPTSHRRTVTSPSLPPPGASKTVLAAGVTLQSAESYFKALSQWGFFFGGVVWFGVFYFFIFWCLCLEP